MFIEFTDIEEKVFMVKIDLLNGFEKNGDMFWVVLNNSDQHITIDARTYQKIRNKFKEAGLLL